MPTDQLTAALVSEPPPPLGAAVPVFLDLDQRRVLLVGGGAEALAQLQTVLTEHPTATIAVLAPSFLPAFQPLAARYPQVTLLARRFVVADLAGHDLVLVATPDAELLGEVRAGAAARRLHAVAALGPPDEDTAIRYWRRVATWALVTFAAFLVVDIISFYYTWPQVWQGLRGATQLYTFIGVGFVAQLIDGMLGMGYGIVSAISLMTLGLPPASVSASIHTAEMFASGASGYHHYRFGNVNKRLFRVLLVPGVLGSIAGALLLTRLGEQHARYLKPLLALYLLVLGVRIISKAVAAARGQQRRKVKYAGWLAGAGGFLDSFGGGGWGPLVTSTLIANGRTPNYVIGTVSLVEFFVTLASAITFFSVLGLTHWQIVAGLIVGGVAAAPLAARLAGRIPTKWMFISVGAMVVFWSLWSLWKGWPALMKLL